MNLTPYQWRTLAWLALALAAWLALNALAPVVLPFVLGAVLAYALHPLVEALAQRRWPRWLGAGVALLAVGIVLTAVALLIVPVVTRQIPLLREQLPQLLDQLNATLKPWAQRLGVEVSVDVQAVREALRNMLTGHEADLTGKLLSSLRIGGSAVAAVLGNLVLTPIVAFYMLLEWEEMVERAKSFIPPRFADAVQRFLTETDAVLGQYLRGQLVVMGMLAVFYTVGLALVGLKLAVPIGVFTGLAVFVPYIGFGLGLVLAVVAAALQFQAWSGVLLVLLVYGVGQVVESMWLTPRLLGERIGLHPLAVIFALMAFGHLFGFVGVLVALPVSAVLLVGLRRARAWYLGSELYRGEPLRARAAAAETAAAAPTAAPATGETRGP